MDNLSVFLFEHNKKSAFPLNPGKVSPPLPYGVKKAFFDKHTCTFGDQLSSDGQLNASEVSLDILILSSCIKPLNEPGHNRSLVPSL